MIYYLDGMINDVNNSEIVIDVNGIGYQVLVSHPEQYIKNKKYKVYIHEVIREDDHYLVGFCDEKEKSVFLSLLKVQGLGPKTAICILKQVSPDELINAILSNNFIFLKRIPKVGPKVAYQLLSLKSEFSNKKCDPLLYQEVYDSLKMMGFKKEPIEKTLSLINIPDGTYEEILKIALSKLGGKA